MRLLIFGLGYCGRAAATLACRAGWEVVATSRSPAPARAPGLRLVPFDSAGPEIAAATHILATAPPRDGADPVLARYAAELRAASALAWIGYLSTTGVYGDRGGGWVDEATEPAPTAERSRRRLAAELAWRALAAPPPPRTTQASPAQAAPAAHVAATSPPNNTPLSPSPPHDAPLGTPSPHDTSLSPSSRHDASLGSPSPQGASLCTSSRDDAGLRTPSPHDTSLSPSSRHDAGLGPSSRHDTGFGPPSRDDAGLGTSPRHDAGLGRSSRGGAGAPSCETAGAVRPDGGRPLDIFRLAGIYGPGRSAFDDLRAGRARRIVQPGHAFGRIHVDDIAAGIMAAIAHPPQGVRVLNFSDDEPAESADVTAEAARLLGLPVPPAVPFDEASPAMSEMARSFWAENRRVASRTTQDALAMRWKYPTYREGLRAILDAETGKQAVVF